MATRWGRLEVSDILVLEPQRLVQPHGPGYPRGGPKPTVARPIRADEEFCTSKIMAASRLRRDITKTLWYILVYPDSIAPAYLSRHQEDSGGGMWKGALKSGSE